jgi:triosephosphate isomerase
MRRKLVVGNWKMHGSRPANAELLSALLAAGPMGCDVAVCVPFPFLGDAAVSLAASDLRWGAQDCSAHDRVPIPAKCRRQCWPSSVAAT